MRKSIVLLALAVLNANAVDCIRETFEYFATQYMPEDDIKMHILPGKLKPDSLHQKEKSLTYTAKYHWTGNHLDKRTIGHFCLDEGGEGSYVPNWKVDSTKVDKLKKYTLTLPPNDVYTNFTVYRGKDSVDIVTGSTHHTFYIKNDTIHELNNWIPKNWVIYRDPKNESKCYRANGTKTIYFTYEYETRGDLLIQYIFQPNHNKYIKPPGPCDGGDKYTTIFYRKSK